MTLPDSSTGQEVRRPQRADGVGAALRAAFGCASLPEDIARLVRKLDRQR